MSNPPPRKHIQRPRGADDATPVGSMTLSGVIRTTKGYALATAVFSPDGSLTSLALGISQAYPHGKPHIAREHVRLATELAGKL